MTMNTLEQGTPAFNFSGIDQDQNHISLGDYKGKKLIIFKGLVIILL